MAFYSTPPPLALGVTSVASVSGKWSVAAWQWPFVVVCLKHWAPRLATTFLDWSHYPLDQCAPQTDRRMKNEGATNSR